LDHYYDYLFLYRLLAILPYSLKILLLKCFAKKECIYLYRNYAKIKPEMKKERVNSYTVVARGEVDDLDSISSVKKLRPLCEKIVNKFSFNVISVKFHQFKPRGVTGFFLISQSHIAIHTWPEAGTVFLEISSSYSKRQVDLFVKEMFVQLGCKKRVVRTVLL
jgi:S-adenosylmethionine decarboxylase